MHISEGILSGSVLATGGVLAASGTIIGLRDMKGEDFVKVSLLSSSFFVASLIHVPVGPSSAHLVLNGLCGIILGWKSFPAILVSLFLQAILFQFGGLTTLGVNTCNMAIPAVISYYLFRPLFKKNLFLTGFLSGFFSILLSCLFVSLSLISTNKYFLNIVKTITLVHLPIAFIEGIITGFILTFLKKTKSEIMGG
jgi:cobalt/nickel transport system permease protein